jgi:hypothetical protein
LFEPNTPVFRYLIHDRPVGRRNRNAFEKEKSMRRHTKRNAGPMVVMLAVAIALVSIPAAANLPDTPDGTIKQVFESLANRHPEILWQALPPTYQRDITELTHAVADKVDPELWNGVFGLGSQVAVVLRDKREYFLNSSMMNAAGEERARIEENWDTAVAALDGFFTSEFSNLENLKTMDWEGFLSTTAVDIMDRVVEIQAEKGAEEDFEDIAAKLRNTTVETVSRDGDVATVRVSTPGEDPEEVSVTRVEGRWVPTDMAEDWDTNMAEAKENIANVTEEQMAQAKMQAMMVFGMVQAGLDQLAATNSQEEFDQAIQGLLGPFMGMAGGMQE